METPRPLPCSVRTGQTIQTRFLPATDHRGARVSVRHSHGRRMVAPYDHGISATDNHCAAAQKMVFQLSPPGGVLSVELIGGPIAPGRYAFALVEIED